MSPLAASQPTVLAYGENDFNAYWLLALVLITFINWVATRLKKRRAEKRGERFDFDPEVFAPYRDRLEREADARPKAEAEARDTASEVRDFFAALTGQQPQTRAPQTEPTAPEPPPVRPMPAVAVRVPPVVTAGISGNAYLQRLSSAKARAPVPSEEVRLAAERYRRDFGSMVKARSALGRDRHDALMVLLGARGSLRTAFLLREVLGPPKALEDDPEIPFG